MNFSIIIMILGTIILLTGGFFLLPVITGVIYGEYHIALIYLFLGGAYVVCGYLIRKLHKPEKDTFYAKEGFVAVALSWIVMSLLGAFPFMLTGEIPALADALFETVSGFTTTGSSILTDVEALSHASLIWRSFTHWVGGMGVLVFMLAVLPMTGGSSMNLMKAESPGPSVGKLVPKIRHTAFLLYAIYGIMTVILVLLLLMFGMPLFDSLCTAFGTAGTGGFGILNSSMGHYSPLLQNIVTVFMLLFGVNFSFYYYILIRKQEEAFAMEEIRWYFIIYAAAVVLITLNLRTGADVQVGKSVADTIRFAAFQVSSVMTTTGFSTADFNRWPAFSRTILVLVMFIGACAGSTGGGMKVSRILLYFRQIRRELGKQIHPRTVKVLKMDGRTLEKDVLHSASVFLMAYVVIFALSVLIITLENKDLTTSFTAVAATINNIGPGLNEVVPTGNFHGFSPLSKYVFIFDMLAGRLELFPMLLLFAPDTWKK